MTFNDYLTIGLRLFFWIATTMALAQGSLFAIVLCLTGFLVIEKCLEDISNEWD